MKHTFLKSAVAPAEKLLTLAQVLERMNVGRSTWLNGVRAGRFPKPIFVSPRRPSWRQSCIDKLIDSL